MAGYGWTFLKWQDMAGHFLNGMIWLDMGGNGCKWLEIARKGWNMLEIT